MKFFQWFASRGTQKATEELLPKQVDHIAEQKSVFQSIVEQIHDEYKQKIEMEQARIVELEVLVGALEDDLAKQRSRIRQLEATLNLEAEQPKLTKKDEKAQTISLIEVLDSLKKYAENNNSLAQFYLGVSYIFGVGKKRNSLLGEQWLSRSASQPNSAIYFLLGILKNQGILLDRGPQQALHWMTLARQYGLRGVEEYVDSIKGEVQKIEKEQEDVRKLRREEDLRNVPENLREREKNSSSKTSAPSFLAVSGSRHIDPTNRFSWSLEFPEDSYSAIQLKAYKLGYQRGLECYKKALRMSKLMSSRRDFASSDLKAVARRFAMRHGYLQHTINEGMEGLAPESLLTPDVREAFIKGVNYGILQRVLSE